MKEYIRHFIAMFATFFTSQSTLTPGAVAQDRDAQEWAAAKADGSLRAFEDFLARHPVGPYSRDAFREIIRLSDGDANSWPICDDIGVADPTLIDEDCVPISALY